VASDHGLIEKASARVDGHIKRVREMYETHQAGMTQAIMSLADTPAASEVGAYDISSANTVVPAAPSSGPAVGLYTLGDYDPEAAFRGR
jgi:hypothetical protein